MLTEAQMRALRVRREIYRSARVFIPMLTNAHYPTKCSFPFRALKSLMRSSLLLNARSHLTDIATIERISEVVLVSQSLWPDWDNYNGLLEAASTELRKKIIQS